MVFCFSNIVQM